jgi:hypothetical protein
MNNGILARAAICMEVSRRQRRVVPIEVAGSHNAVRNKGLSSESCFRRPWPRRSEKGETRSPRACVPETPINFWNLTGGGRIPGTIVPLIPPLFRQAKLLKWSGHAMPCHLSDALILKLLNSHSLSQELGFRSHWDSRAWGQLLHEIEDMKTITNKESK